MHIHLLKSASQKMQNGIFSRDVLNMLDLAIKLKPENPQGYFYYGQYCFNTGNFATAIEHYNQAERLDFSHKFLLYAERAICYSRLGKFKESIRDFHMADFTEDLNKTEYGKEFLLAQDGCMNIPLATLKPTSNENKAMNDENQFPILSSIKSNTETEASPPPTKKLKISNTKQQDLFTYFKSSSFQTNDDVILKNLDNRKPGLM